MSHLNNYIIGKNIGCGGYSKIFKAYNKANLNEIVAIKIIPVNKFKGTLLKSQLKNEIYASMALKHNNIVQCYSGFKGHNIYCFTFEYAMLGDLYKYNQMCKLKMCNIKNIFKKVAFGLRYCHNMGFIHRDIKPDNILLRHNLDPVICDFGWCFKICKNKMYPPKRLAGTLDYMAPEILMYKKYTFKVDIWSYGVTLYEMLIGKTPFYNDDLEITVHNIKTAKINLKKTGLDKDSKYLLSLILVKKPNQRKCWDVLLNCNWFAI